LQRISGLYFTRSATVQHAVPRRHLSRASGTCSPISIETRRRAMMEASEAHLVVSAPQPMHTPLASQWSSCMTKEADICCCWADGRREAGRRYEAREVECVRTGEQSGRIVRVVDDSQVNRLDYHAMTSSFHFTMRSCILGFMFFFLFETFD